MHISVKIFTLVLISVAAVPSLGLAFIPNVYAQSTTVPIAPQFTLTFENNSRIIPQNTTVTINPYTGKQTVTVSTSYFVQNDSIDLIIENQPFTPYIDSNRNFVQLYYNVTWKGHFSSSWSGFQPTVLVNQTTNSDFTIIPFAFVGNYYAINNQEASISSNALGGKVDFKVEALIGYYTLVYSYIPGNNFPVGAYYNFTTENSSGWSKIQTITATSTSVPPDTPEMSWIVIIPLMTFVLVIAINFRHRTTQTISR